HLHCAPFRSPPGTTVRRGETDEDGHGGGERPQARDESWRRGKSYPSTHNRKEPANCSRERGERMTERDDMLEGCETRWLHRKESR
ncbi:MAG: hypothetical protein ACRDXC_14095, partial [Acidimicrobiales bacterium]